MFGPPEIPPKIVECRLRHEQARIFLFADGLDACGHVDRVADGR
jgi:hypothetical protein